MWKELFLSGVLGAGALLNAGCTPKPTQQPEATKTPPPATAAPTATDFCGYVPDVVTGKIDADHPTLISEALNLLGNDYVALSNCATTAYQRTDGLAQGYTNGWDLQNGKANPTVQPGAKVCVGKDTKAVMDACTAPGAVKSTPQSFNDSGRWFTSKQARLNRMNNDFRG